MHFIHKTKMLEVFIGSIIGGFMTGLTDGLAISKKLLMTLRMCLPSLSGE